MPSKCPIGCVFAESLGTTRRLRQPRGRGPNHEAAREKHEERLRRDFPKYYSPGGTEVNVELGGVLSVRWTGGKGRGSLFQLSAESNAEMLNRLTFEQIAAVLAAVQARPFPLGEEDDVYRLALNHMDTVWLANLKSKFTLGELRRAVLYKAGSGMNAPTDTYLRVAVALKAEHYGQGRANWADLPLVLESEYALAEHYGQQRLPGFNGWWRR